MKRSQSCLFLDLRIHLHVWEIGLFYLFGLDQYCFADEGLSFEYAFIFIKAKVPAYLVRALLYGRVLLLESGFSICAGAICLSKVDRFVFRFPFIVLVQDG